MKIITGILIIFFSGIVNAGDYMIFIKNINNTNSNCRGATHWQTVTSPEIVNAFQEYFSGKEPSVKNLRPAFANGHFHFCGSSEINTVLNGLYSIQSAGVKHHKSHLPDFISKIKAIQ